MRKTPLRRKRKGEDALLTQKLDKEWARVVKKNAQGKCEVCTFVPNVLHAHHIVSRGRFRLRWEPRNGVALCYRHHFGLAHGDVIEQGKWRQWLKSNRGDDFDYVLAHAEELGRWTIPEKRDHLTILVAL